MAKGNVSSYSFYNVQQGSPREDKEYIHLCDSCVSKFPTWQHTTIPRYRGGPTFTYPMWDHPMYGEIKRDTPHWEDYSKPHRCADCGAEGDSPSY